MTATVEVEPGMLVPLKCPSHNAAGVTPNPCTQPGSMARCMLCPASPTFWRKTAGSTPEGVFA